MNLQKPRFRKNFSLACLVSVPVLFGLYSIKLGQDNNWDLLNYHLYNPYSYIHNRMHLDLAPAGLQTYFNPVLDLAYFSAVSHLSPALVGFLIGLLQGLSFIFLHKIARQIIGNGREGYVLIIAIAGLLSVGFLSELGTTLHDSLVGVLTLASLWLAMSAIKYIGTDQRRSIAVVGASGVLMGIACGLKLVFAIYALALLLGLIFVPQPLAARFKLALPFAFCALAGLLITGGGWLYKVWIEFGNPLFPQFNHLFRGELVSSEPIRDIRFLPKDLYEKLFYPAIFTVDPLRVSELPYKQVSWIFGYVALLALGCAILFRSNKIPEASKLSPQVVLLVYYIFISYILWINLFGIYRYLIPIEVLIPLLLFVCIDHFFKLHVPRWGTVAFLSLITLANLKGIPDWGHSDWSVKLYRVETSALSLHEPAAVYLVGQPLAWLIPALELKTPFIQLAPNMPVTDAYWKKGMEVVEGRTGKQFAIFESPSPDLTSRARGGLAKLGLVLDEAACDRLVAHLGTARYEYRFCEVKKSL